jgi:dihydrofolate reductase
MVKIAPEIILIAAIDRNRAIGKAGALPWRLPEDLKRFKALTLGQTVLMGRKTYDSIGRALPGRRNFVLTHDQCWRAAGTEVFTSFASALGACTTPELWVIGGGEIYAQTIAQANRLEITHVDIAVEGADAWFPVIGDAFDAGPSRVISSVGIEFYFCRYTRR